MPDDRRAVLEGIAHGDDARITPGDRLRALEQLRQLDPSAEANALLARDGFPVGVGRCADTYLARGEPKIEGSHPLCGSKPSANARPVAPPAPHGAPQPPSRIP